MFGNETITILKSLIPALKFSSEGVRKFQQVFPRENFSFFRKSYVEIMKLYDKNIPKRTTQDAFFV